jgi:hypothetical protein
MLRRASSFAENPLTIQISATILELQFQNIREKAINYNKCLIFSCFSGYTPMQIKKFHIFV